MPTTTVKPICRICFGACGVVVGLDDKGRIADIRGDMKQMRERWIETEALGADVLWVADHFHAQVVSEDNFESASHSGVDPRAKNFESTTIQAGWPRRPRVPASAASCTRTATGIPTRWRDIARTIDHIAGVRYIPGMGAGYLRPDDDEYRYDYGTTTSRLQDFARNLPVIKTRMKKLNPPPLGSLPMMIASMGDKLGLRIVAEHVDMWQVYGVGKGARRTLKGIVGHPDKILGRYAHCGRHG